LLSHLDMLSPCLNAGAVSELESLD
jgi:hypothetical protein